MLNNVLHNFVWSACLVEFSFLCTVCQLQWTLPYGGKQVTGVLGSSFNFSWTFNGGSAKMIQWGTKRTGSFAFVETLVTITKSTTVTITTISDPSPYSGHVGGFWDGTSPGQVTFTLNLTRKEDERIYMCRIRDGLLDGEVIFDTVKLLVLGRYIYV